MSSRSLPYEDDAILLELNDAPFRGPGRAERAGGGIGIVFARVEALQCRANDLQRALIDVLGMGEGIFVGVEVCSLEIVAIATRFCSDVAVR